MIYAERIADIYLAAELAPVEPPATGDLAAVTTAAADLRRNAGIYLSRDLSVSYHVDMSSGKLGVIDDGDGSITNLVPLGGARFRMLAGATGR